jgi:large subunit ribosomal protein L29
MQAKEIRGWTTEELMGRLEQGCEELFGLRREWVLGRLEDYNRLSAVKRDIARMRTILRERELSAEVAAGGEEE